MENLTMEELEANLVLIGQSPKDFGRLDLIVRRPAVDQREVLAEGTLDLRLGLAGDGWSSRKGLKMDGGLPNPDTTIDPDELARDRIAGADERALASGRRPALC